MKRILLFVILTTFILLATTNIKGINEEEPPLFDTAFNFKTFSEEEPPLFGAIKELNRDVTPDNEEEPPLF